MSNVVITCAGTIGDHLPYIALGQALHRRGHQVRLACRPALHGMALTAGLAVAPCGEDFDDVDARRRAQEWDEWGDRLPRSTASAAEGPAAPTTQVDMWVRASEQLQRSLPTTYAELATACAEADLVVAGVQRMLHAALLSRNTGLRWVASSVTPALQCAAVGRHRMRQDPRLMGAFVPLLNAVCSAQSLEPINWLAYDREHPRALLGASAHFAVPLPGYDHFQPTGFWFYEHSQAAQWTPPKALQDFVKHYPGPLYLSFSSIPVIDPAAVLNLHARAAALLGLGLVVQRGAAGFDTALLADDVDPRGVHFVDFMPPDWLLARCGAILHHGGAGTLARALCNGCPMLVEPLGNDQFFNAQRVLALQVGAAVSLHRIGSQGLARVLEDKVLAPGARAAAKALGAQLAAEDGVGRACDLLERWLA